MPPGEHEAAREPPLRLPREVEHLGHVGEVVEREANRLRPERVELADVVAVTEDLQIEEPNVVAGGGDGSRHPLEPERLEP